MSRKNCGDCKMPLDENMYYCPRCGTASPFSITADSLIGIRRQLYQGNSVEGQLVNGRKFRGQVHSHTFDHLSLIRFEVENSEGEFEPFRAKNSINDEIFVLFSSIAFFQRSYSEEEKAASDKADDEFELEMDALHKKHVEEIANLKLEPVDSEGSDELKNKT